MIAVGQEAFQCIYTIYIGMTKSNNLTATGTIIYTGQQQTSQQQHHDFLQKKSAVTTAHFVENWFNANNVQW